MCDPHFKKEKVFGVIRYKGNVSVKLMLKCTAKYVLVNLTFDSGYIRNNNNINVDMFDIRDTNILHRFSRPILPVTEC